MSANRPRTIRLRTCTLFVTAVSMLIPSTRRADWLAEWKGELWQLLKHPSNVPAGKLPGILSFLGGAIKHALWERQHFRRTRGQNTIAPSRSNPIQRRAGSILASLAQDIRYASRQSLKRPAFALLVCTILALGIGANTALFSVVYGVLLRPLPYPDSHELVTIWWQNTDRGWTHNALTAADFRDLRAENETFEAMGFLTPVSATILSGQHPQRVAAHAVTPEVFAATAVPPLLGRLFLPEDDVPGAPSVAILSHGLWQRDFGSDPDIIGKTVRLNWGHYEIVGVMPAEFRWTVWGEPQLWFPPRLNEQQRNSRTNHWLIGVGRMRDGIELAQAQVDLSAIVSRLEQAYPESNTATDITVEKISTTMVGDVRFTLWLILGGAGVILLIASANVASLYLSQFSARRREMAVRASLGAGRARLLRQLLAESILFAAAGGAAGLVFAHIGVRIFLALEPGNLPRTEGITTNTEVLLFCMAVTAASCVFFALVPALVSSETDLKSSLNAAGHSNSQRPSSIRLKNVLAVVQMATSVVLLAGAGLLMRSFSRLQQVDPGFEVENVLMARVPQGGARYQNAEDRVRFQDELISRIERDPNVLAAAATTEPPLSMTPQILFAVEGREPVDGQQPVASRLYVSPDYFNVLGMSLLAGRLLNKDDVDGMPRVAVISDETARRFWPDEDPLGAVFTLGSPTRLEVVGVVSDLRQYGVRYRPFPAAFLPYAQAPAGDYHVMVKTSSVPSTVIPTLRAVVHDLDPELAIYGIETLEDRVAENVANTKFLMLLGTAFALIATVLAATGIYGVLAYSVSQRAREFGIRMALGARRELVLGSVLYQGIVLAGIAVLVGLPLAYAISRTMRRMLYEIGTADPMTFGAIIVLVFAVSIVACYLPAARAASSDPLKALRIE